MSITISLSYFLKVILPAIIAVAIGISIEQILESKAESFGNKKGSLKQHIHVTKLIIRWISTIVILLVVASIFGMAIGRLWLSISAILSMIIIGFIAGWSLIGNILAGIIVMFWRPFEIGDKISILPEDISGKITDINLFYGNLETEDGDSIQVPNVMFLQKFVKVKSKAPQNDQGFSKTD